MEPDLENDRKINQVWAGRGTYWGANCRFSTYHDAEIIRIGRYCSIANEVTIFSGGNHRTDLPSTWPFDNLLRGLSNPTRTYDNEHTNTTIGSDVWIGEGAHIGGGVHIGDGSVIGAQAVVFSDVAPYSIVVGNPARILRPRFSTTIIEALLNIRWWEWSPTDLSARLEWFYRPVEEFIAEFQPPR